MRRAIYEDDVIKLLDKGWKSGVYPVASNIHALPSAQPDNQTNLCDSCDYSHPDCPSKNDDVIFGNGIGNDNICACNKYKPSVQPELTDVQAIEHLRESGWMQNHDKQMYEMGLREQLADDSDSYDALLPSAQPEPDWDYSEETKQITLIVPEDVYNSAETIFLSVGYEGTFGIRGMVYSAQPSSSCAHENDSISRRATIDAVLKESNTDGAYGYMDTKSIVDLLNEQPPAQPEQDILAWLLAYHMKSFDLKGRYMAHEVIGWLVHDFATAYMAERREDGNG